MRERERWCAFLVCLPALSVVVSFGVSYDFSLSRDTPKPSLSLCSFLSTSTSEMVKALHSIVVQLQLELQATDDRPSTLATAENIRAKADLRFRGPTR